MSNIVALILATMVLVMIPGPNVALIIANSLRHGLKFGLLTTLGTTTGVAIQLFLVVGGMAAVIELAASSLLWIKWLGVAYLIYLGIRTWNEPTGNLAEMPAQTQAGSFWRGLAFAVINPKTLLFNAAFLPQFAAAGGDAPGQLFVLAGVFLTVILVGDSMWAIFAASARNSLKNCEKIRNKVTGGMLCGAGLGLAVSRRSL
jgi:threonine/homoserine/homoserine lactone efflux protein